MQTDTPIGKLAIVADLHLGPRSLSVGSIWSQGVVAERMLMAFYELYIWAEENKYRSVIVAGDFFDRSLIPPKLIDAINRQARRYHSMSGFRMYVTPGNHDLDSHNGSAMDYLTKSGFKVIDRPSVVEVEDSSSVLPSTYVAVVPFSLEFTPQEGIERVLELVDSFSNPPRVMVGHFGIYGDDSPPWMKHDRNSVHLASLNSILKGTPIQIVAVGHYHRWGDWPMSNARVIQIGSLSPNSFGELGMNFGNVLEVHGTALGPMHTKLRLGAISGVRYLTSNAQFTDIGPVAKRCWYILRDIKNLDTMEIHKIRPLKDPKNVIDTYGAFTVMDYNKPAGTTARMIDDVGLDPKEAVEKYVKAGVKERKFKTKAGIVSDAINRLTDLPQTVTVAPESMRKANGCFSTDVY